MLSRKCMQVCDNERGRIEVDYLCHLCLKIGGQLNKNEMYDDAIGLLRVAQENVGVLDEKHGQLCKKLRIRIMRALGMLKVLEIEISR
ncbi:hypothetical protein BC937DRAFT_94123 [Endogone sp. FLAS-F59071]|nr:hypothetical protein BC937DRAFT_94123 [Endogone sp. FLAS-F59071]|eukprot:RUS23003.1 hypothetical protein BC937DRAFT_94123 [Endogone sp. FLAS-F59071]